MATESFRQFLNNQFLCAKAYFKNRNNFTAKKIIVKAFEVLSKDVMLHTKFNKCLHQLNIAIITELNLG